MEDLDDLEDGSNDGVNGQSDYDDVTKWKYNQDVHIVLSGLTEATVARALCQPLSRLAGIRQLNVTSSCNRVSKLSWFPAKSQSSWFRGSGGGML